MLGDGLEQHDAGLLGGRREVGRNVHLVPGRALRGVIEDERLHRDQVDVTTEHLPVADRNLDRDGVGAEAVLHHLDRVLEVGACAVHLVDERDTRDVVLVHLPPDRLGLGLHAADRAEQRDRAVEHAQRTLHLDGEVDVAGGVDDVDAVALPLRGRRRRGDGDATLLLLLHPVHRGAALMDLADPVRLAGVVQDALGRRGLARVDVRRDPDVSGLGERKGLALEVGHWRSSVRGGSRGNAPVSPRGGSAYDGSVRSGRSERTPCWPRPCGACRPSS